MSYQGEGDKAAKKVAAHGLGRTGERLAAEELIRAGYRILECNFYCRYGEIDLVAEHGHDLVFVEVKTRRGNAYGLPEESVTVRKQRKLIQTAIFILIFIIVLNDHGVLTLLLYS